MYVCTYPSSFGLGSGPTTHRILKCGALEYVGIGEWSISGLLRPPGNTWHVLGHNLAIIPNAAMGGALIHRS